MARISRDLTQGSIPLLLYRLTTPMVMGILAIFLFNLVDMFFISMLGTEPLAAVSFTFPITMVLLNLAIGLSIGAGAVIARAFGQKDHQAIHNWINSALLLTGLVSITSCGLVFVFQTQLYTLLGAKAELIPLIQLYLNWWLVGGVVLIVLMVINAIIRASGNTLLPGRIMMFSAVINGVFDPLLIFGFGPFPALGIEGAAISTVISWLTAFAVIVRALYKDGLLEFKWPTKLTQHWRALLSLSIPAALTNIMVPIANGVLVALVAGYGTHAVAAYGVGMRLEPIAMMVVLALTSSLPPFVGQNLGAGNTQRIAEGVVRSLQFIVIWQLLIYALFALSAPFISQAFSDQAEVQTLISLFIYILPLSYFGTGFALVTNATLNALHHPRISLVLSVFRLFGLYLPAAYIGHMEWGLKGLFIGCASANIVMGLIVIWLVHQTCRKTSWQVRLTNPVNQSS